MANHTNNALDKEKAKFILTGLNCGYVPEWLPLYARIMKYVTVLYDERDKLYRNMTIIESNNHSSM